MDSNYINALLGILLSAVLTENYILVKFYGICPFMGVSKKIDTALGMGMAVTFVMALASAACYLVNLLLVGLNAQYMQTVAFILVIASIVQVVEMFLKKAVPSLYKALGIYLPLITTNCAVLGAALVIMCVIRELLGSGTFGTGVLNGGEGILIIPGPYPAMQMVMPVGGFITLGLVIAGSQKLMTHLERKNKKKEAGKV